jgi:predicted DNA-binding protein
MHTKKRICFSYSKELKENLENIARKENRTLTNYIICVLDEHIARLTKKGLVGEEVKHVKKHNYHGN